MTVSYQVFARKYRPLSFDDILGQDHVVRTLTNAINQNRLAHAYLFVGPRGTGKTSTARIFAKALNCTGGPKVDFDPTEDICVEIAEGRSLDVLEIDGASNRGIDHIRDLRDNVRFAPSKGSYRIVYIDEVHMLTKESFNALLKTLEEPPPHVKFIFATTEPHKILPTILSRCQRFDLRPIPADLIARHLLHIAGIEGVSLSEEAAFAVAKAADGGMRDAQSMLDQLVSFCGNSISEEQVLDIFGITSRETVASILSFILQRNLPHLLNLVNEQAAAGRDLGQLLSEIIASVREILVAKVDSSVELKTVPKDRQQEFLQLLGNTKIDKILRLVEILSETEEKLRWSSHKKLHLEIGLIKSVHSLSEANISDIIRAFEGAPLPDLPPLKTTPATPEKQTPPPTAHAETVKEATPPAKTPEPERSTPPPAVETRQEPEPAPATPEPEEDKKTQEEQPEPSSPAALDEILPDEDQIPVFSALSDAPVSPPAHDDEDTPALEDEEPVREDTLTGSLFGSFNNPAPPAAPQGEQEDSLPSLNEQTWVDLLEQLADRFPMKAELLRHAKFIRHDGAFYVLGVHPNDNLGYDTLLQQDIKNEIEKNLSVKCGTSITLTIEKDSSIPEPIEEELEPLPAPPPAPEEQKTAAKKPASADRTEQSATPEEGQPEQTTKEDFFDDPFVQQALDIFKARIIKQ